MLGDCQLVIQFFLLNNGGKGYSFISLHITLCSWATNVKVIEQLGIRAGLLTSHSWQCLLKILLIHSRITYLQTNGGCQACRRYLPCWLLQTFHFGWWQLFTKILKLFYRLIYDHSSLTPRKAFFTHKERFECDSRHREKQGVLTGSGPAGISSVVVPSGWGSSCWTIHSVFFFTSGTLIYA